MSTNTNTETVSVKVMRSHDYCHFEVNLSVGLVAGGSLDEMVNAADKLRKEAARLADKAVSQYQVMKANAAKLQSETQDRTYLARRMAAIEAIAEGDRTVRDQAELKAFKDAKWEASHRYDYEDDWNED